MNNLEIRLWDGERLLFKKIHDPFWKCNNKQHSISKPFINIQVILPTELFDINNTPIYRGDILSIKNEIDESIVIGAVTYINQPDQIFTGQLVVTNNDGSFNDLSIENETQPEFWHLATVIGNIYESPELNENQSSISQAA